MPRDSAAVGLADSAGIGGKTFVTHGLPVLAIGGDDVGAGNFLGGAEKRQADSGRHFEERAVLVRGRPPKPGVERRQLFG
jgi:hypothetical protein